jgi:hypothetical protein
MNQLSHIVTFDVTCPEPRAWLVLIAGNREAQVLEMRQRCPSEWFASADLSPGEYRCRYYGGDDRHVHYYGPANLEGSINCGMDALVLVKNPKETMQPEIVQ